MNDINSIGTATSLSTTESESVELILDGKCIRATSRVLTSGANAIGNEILDKVKEQSERFIEQVVLTYENKVATGEVGGNGTGKVNSEKSISGDETPVGLLYGRIQSGKTLAMITSAALSIDNGFRIIIVFTSDNVSLVKQTAERFAAVQGPIIKDTSSRTETQWEQDIDHVQRFLGKSGLIIISAKNTGHLKALNAFLLKLEAHKYPALIMDDEADQASLDNNTRKRATAIKKNLGIDADALGGNIRSSKIHSQLVSSRESISNVLHHCVFIQVTATPFALFLLNDRENLRPTFVFRLEPGEGYTGGEYFFSNEYLELSKPPLVFVQDSKDELESGTNNSENVPDGLKEAIAFFLVSAAAQRLMYPTTAMIGQNFLCHTSHKKVDHKSLASFIRSYYGRLNDDITESGPLPKSEAKFRFSVAYDELSKTYREEIPSDTEIFSEISAFMSRRQVIVVNSENDPANFGQGQNFIIGGNILGRGLTIENLLVTYYMREPKVSQMDTMLQHARMFGYRKNYMPFLRVYLPHQLAMRFNSIHESEKELRDQIEENPKGQVTIQLSGSLRPTRTGVLDPGEIYAFTPGKQHYPKYPEYRAEVVGNSPSAVEQIISNCLGQKFEIKEFDKKRVENRFIESSISLVENMIKKIPTHPDNMYMWNPKALITALREVSEKYDDKAYLYIRSFESEAAQRRFKHGEGMTLPSAVASGEEARLISNKDKPVLALFQARLDTQEEQWDNEKTKFWYPTVIFPRNNPTMVYNDSTFRSEDG